MIKKIILTMLSVSIMLPASTFAEGIKQFETGQVWSYNSRAGELESTIIILKVENEIIHVSVEGVKIPDKSSSKGYSTRIAHLPFMREFLQKSVVKLVSFTTEIPKFERGYQKWKKAFDKGEAGGFRMTVSEALDFVEGIVK